MGTQVYPHRRTNHSATWLVLSWECLAPWVRSLQDIKGSLYITRLFHHHMAMRHHLKLLLHQPRGYFRKLSSWGQQCRHQDLAAKTRAAGQVAAVSYLFSVNHVLSKAGRSAWGLPTLSRPGSQMPPIVGIQTLEEMTYQPLPLLFLQPLCCVPALLIVPPFLPIRGTPRDL